MPHDPFRWATLILGVAAMAVMIGCARWIEVAPSAMSQRGAVAGSIAEHDRVPLLLEGFRVTQNGAAQHPSSAVERRILNQVQETKLFSILIPFGSTASGQDKVVTARIRFDETIDAHGGQAAWKGFAIGASMFLLSPLIELHYDYAAQASLELERWDGQVKRYEARSAGTAHYNLFGASPLVIDELKGEVTEACLTDLVEQLVRDTHWYVASHTPLPDLSIRTVIVKGRTPAPRTSAIVPISLPSAP